jgi:hypothetical protein
MWASEDKRINYLCTCDLCSPVRNVLDGCIYIRWGSGRGLGSGIPEFFGPCVPFGASGYVNFRAERLKVEKEKQDRR